MERRLSALFWCAAFCTTVAYGMTNKELNDPFPLYASTDPHEFLYTKGKDILRNGSSDMDAERVNITISIFGQRATDARNLQKETVPLANVHGPWNMLALTYAPCPTTTLIPALDFAANTAYACTSTIYFGDDAAFTDPLVSANTTPDFGKVEVDGGIYRKLGFRFEMGFLLGEDIGCKIQGGLSEVFQSYTTFVDLSPFNQPLVGEDGTSCCGTSTCCLADNVCNVANVLTSTLAIKTIAHQMKLDINTFQETHLEDLRLGLFWRHAFLVNEGRSSWPQFLFMPFVQILGCVGLSSIKDPHKQFSLSTGNNGHSSYGFNLGFSLDFNETLELVFEGGGTFFLPRNLSMRVPTHVDQNGIFPCVTRACIHPGNNWHAIATLNARRFLEHLSAYVQYAAVSHLSDHITAPAGFTTAVLERQSKWSVQFLNSGFNYEISPYARLGIVWQAPLGKRGVFRSNTLLGSCVVLF